jgi:SAM-dependent methyltransferase
MTAAVAGRRDTHWGSLGWRNASVLRTLIRWALHTPLGPAKNPQSTELSRLRSELVAAAAEHADGHRFARRLAGRFGCDDLAHKRVLDLGCGYGGRTVFYAQSCRAAEVVGLEVTEKVVERCREFALQRGASNVSFVVGVAERLPFPDDVFDAVVSFDVLEHVQIRPQPFVRSRAFSRQAAEAGSCFRRTWAREARTWTT